MEKIPKSPRDAGLALVVLIRPGLKKAGMVFGDGRSRVYLASSLNVVSFICW